MDLLTRREAAQYLHIGLTKFSELIKSGKIVYRQDKPGGKMLFECSDLNRYDESRKVVPIRPANIYGTYRKRRASNIGRLNSELTKKW